MSAGVALSGGGCSGGEIADIVSTATHLFAWVALSKWLPARCVCVAGVAANCDLCNHASSSTQPCPKQG
jgi:hypothetical protein